MNKEITASDFFVVGGALPPDSPSYVQRPADDELFEAVLAGQSCHIFAPHHVGKSSLMARTDRRLRQRGVCTVSVDMSGLGADGNVERVYLALVNRLKRQLELDGDAESWWRERASLEPAQRFSGFLGEVLLAEVQEPLVIFVDELDSARDPEICASLFAAVEAAHNARSADAAYERLAFVLLGAVNLDDLGKGAKGASLDFARQIELGDFSRAEAQALRDGLQAACGGEIGPIFDRIFYWTNGHPYLTQKLCLNVARMWDLYWNEERVDGLVDRLFRSAGVRQEPHLQRVEERIWTSSRRRALLGLYRQIYGGRQVMDTPQAPEPSWLKLIGLVRSESALLKVRNEVYRLVFDEHWLKAATPTSWTRYAAVVAVVLVILLGGVIGFSIQRQRQQAIQAEAYVDSFRGSAGADDRIANLAQLFNLRGYEDEARQLFFDELDRSEQIALFDEADPGAVGEPLVTVVKGLYTDPRLENTEEQDALLAAMAQPLRQLEGVPGLGAVELGLEINQWLKGRELGRTQGRAQQAIGAYDIAISLNGRNPGTHFDRGLAYVALGDPDRALADFITVLDLDDSWQERVRQAVLDNDQLYAALWGERNEYRPLVALVPSPTATPTVTPTPSPSPTPLPTNTPLPPTSTPTSTPPPTVTATPSPTPRPVGPAPASTPTPSVASGTFVLLHPLSSDDPTYGPTDFEWRWTGPLPPGYGFEVRVWRDGAAPAGVHNAVLDNRNGNVKRIGDNTYRLSTDIKDAFSVQGQSGLYFWNVALVQIDPIYEDVGVEADPGRLRFAASGGDDGGDDGGGGVGID